MVFQTYFTTIVPAKFHHGILWEFAIGESKQRDEFSTQVWGVFLIKALGSWELVDLQPLCLARDPWNIVKPQKKHKPPDRSKTQGSWRDSMLKNPFETRPSAHLCLDCPANFLLIMVTPWRASETYYFLVKLGRFDKQMWNFENR